MTTSAFYDAYAHVLVSHDLMHALYDDPQRLRAAFGLTADELALLRTIAPADVALSGAIVRGKRHQMLHFLFPQASRVLAEFDDGDLLAAYVSDVLTRSDVDVLRAITQGHDFVAWLSARPDETVPSGVLDLARFELAVADLGADPAAADAAQRRAQNPGPTGDLDDFGYPRLAPDVRLVPTGIDVLALPEVTTLLDLAAAPGRSGGVLVRKEWKARTPACFRLGVAAAALLGGCNGGRTVADVVATVHDAHRGAARALLGGAFAEGTIQLTAVPLAAALT